MKQLMELLADPARNPKGGALSANMPVKVQDNLRMTARLGFPGPVLMAEDGDSVFVWDEHGNTVIGTGAPARTIATLQGGGAVVGASANTPPQPELALAPISPPKPSMPTQADDPATFIASLTDAVELRNWVLNTGISGQHASAWAAFASACGWQLPPPDKAEPTQQGEEGNDANPAP